MANEIIAVKDEYKPMTSSIGAVRGFEFEELLLAQFALKARKISSKHYCLFPECENAGKFDDLVIQYRIGSQNCHSFLQLKYRNRKVNELNFKDFKGADDFGLQKYFDSYRTIIKQPDYSNAMIERLYICTTATISEKNPVVLAVGKQRAAETIFVKDNDFANDKFLYIENESAICYKLKDENSFAEFIQTKGMREMELVANFVNIFRLITNYPNTQRLNSLIEQEFWQQFKLTSKNLMFDRFMRNIIKYRRDLDGKALTNAKIEEYIAHAYAINLNSINWSAIEKATIKFRTPEADGFNSQSVLNSNLQIIIINCLNTTYFTKIKLWQAIQCSNLDSESILFIKAAETIVDLRALQYIKIAFKSETFNKLIIECETAEQITLLFSHFAEFELSRNETNIHKKLIFLTKVPIKLNELEFICQQDVLEVNDENISLLDLQQESCDLIMSTTQINFLGRNMKLNELMDTAIAKEIIDGNILYDIVQGRTIDIGQENVLFDTKPFLADIYIERQINEVGNKAYAVSFQKLFKNKINIIIDKPGAGKTEFLKNLASKMRKEKFVTNNEELNEHYTLWPIYIKLSDCFDKIDTILQSGDTIDLQQPQAIDCLVQLIADKYVDNPQYNDITLKLLKHLCLTMKASNQAHEPDAKDPRRFVRIVLLFDGYDELPENFRNFMLKLIACLAKNQIFHIWLTSRPMKQRFEYKLRKGKKYTLAPLTIEQQMDFIFRLIENKASKRSIAQEEDKLRIATNFAILFKIYEAYSDWNSGNTNQLHIKAIFSGLSLTDSDAALNTTMPKWDVAKGLIEFLRMPLHLQMFCELCITALDLCNNFTITDMYAKFIEMKLQIYYKKIKFTAHAHAETMRIDQIANQQHCELALKIFFGLHHLCLQQKASLSQPFHHIGLTTEYNNRVQFMHLTYAEYFLSLFFINDCRHEKQFMDVLLNDVLQNFRDYALTRKFLNDNLKLSKNKIVVANEMRSVNLYINIRCLINAIEEGNLEIVKFLIENAQEDICREMLTSTVPPFIIKLEEYEPDVEHISMLHLAALNANYKELLYLAKNILEDNILKGLLIDKFSKKCEQHIIGATFLHCVVWGGNLMDFINFYDLQFKANSFPELLVAANSIGETILHLHAIKKGDFKVLLPFLENSLELNDFKNLLLKRNQNGETFIQILIEKDLFSDYLLNWFEEINIKYTVENQCDSIGGGTNIFDFLHYKNFIKILEFLDHHWSQVFKKFLKKPEYTTDYTAWNYDISGNQTLIHIQHLQMLLEYLKSKFEKAFSKALLLNQCDNENNTWLRSAIRHNDAFRSILLFAHEMLGDDFAEYLLTTNSSNGQNILHIACLNNTSCSTLIKFLKTNSKKDLLLNQLKRQHDVEGNTCLHYAARADNLSKKMLQELYKLLGDDFKNYLPKTNMAGFHALHLAIQHHNEGVFIKFMNGHSDLDLLFNSLLLQNDAMGHSILQYFSSNSRTCNKLNKILLLAKAKLSSEKFENLVLQKYNNEYSFLHYAIMNEAMPLQYFKELFKLLPEDLLIKLAFMQTNDGHTIMHLISVRNKNEGEPKFKRDFVYLIKRSIKKNDFLKLCAIKDLGNLTYRDHCRD